VRGAAGMSPFEERPSLALDRLADRADYAVIGPMDGRTRVANARTHPYAAICYLEPDFRDDYIYAASGFLIFPDVVLTAAHNVYILRPGRTRRAVPPRYRVTPGRNGAGAPPFGTQPAIHLYAPQRFVAASAATYDFGFIKTARPFQGLPGVFRLAALTDAGLQQVRSRRLLHIAGYPCDKPPGDMWEHAERLDRFTPHSLHYSVDTRRGHSGSPVWVRRDRAGHVAAIGIHASGPPGYDEGECAPGTPVSFAPPGSTNRGVRVTRELIAMGRHVHAGTPHPDLVQLR
jgi:V8-like Glu-specific endopeptidase